MNEKKYEVVPLRALVFNSGKIYLVCPTKRRAKLAEIIQKGRYF